MTVQTLHLAGKRYVIMSEKDYRSLVQSQQEPRMPTADAGGNYPALEALKFSLARDIVRTRRRLGLSQAELARRAAIRPETLNRIERGLTSPSVATIDKLDRALNAAEKADRR